VNSEEQFLPYVAAGILRVDPDGSIWRCKIRRVGNGWSRWDPIEPVRAEGGGRGDLSVRVTGGHGLKLSTPAARLVWAVLRGSISHDELIGHRDFDPSNNDPANLYKCRAVPGKKRPRKPIDEDYAEQLRSACQEPFERRTLEKILKCGTQFEAAESIGCDPSTVGKFLKKLRARISVAEGGTA
jgi:hypothetical protein